MSEIRIDLDSATREELVAEVVRLHEVTERWSSAWQGIIAANARGWSHQVEYLKERLAIYEPGAVS